MRQDHSKIVGFLRVNQYSTKIHLINASRGGRMEKNEEMKNDLHDLHKPEQAHVDFFS